MLESNDRGFDALVKGRVACAFVVLYALLSFTHDWVKANYDSPSADESTNPMYYFILIYFSVWAVTFIVSSTRYINKRRASEEQSDSSKAKDECE